MKKFLSIELPRHYSPDTGVAASMESIIGAMADLKGKWASDRFKDSGKTMLGWMKLAEWRDKTGLVLKARKFAETVRREKNKGITTDIVFVGQGGSIECIKTIYKVFGADKDSPRVHIVDTIDPEVIAGLKNTLPLHTTRFIILSKSMTTMEVHSLYKLFYDLYENKKIVCRGHLSAPYKSSPDAKAHFTLITDEGKAEVKDGALFVTESVRSPFREEVLARGFADVFYIEPCSGGRYSWDTAVGILPAFIMLGKDAGHIVEGAALAEREAKDPNPGANPAALYGLFKYHDAVRDEKPPHADPA